MIGPKTPYSPHFIEGGPVCIGEIWQQADEPPLLGQLLIHICKLLNWDEQMRGGGYAGYNGAAIDYHRKQYGGRALTEGLRYPALPGWLIEGAAPDEPGFTPIGAVAAEVAGFTPLGSTPAGGQSGPADGFTPIGRGGAPLSVFK